MAEIPVTCEDPEKVWEPVKSEFHEREIGEGKIQIGLGFLL